MPFFVFELIRGLKEGHFIEELPEGLIREAAKDAKRVVVVEMNLGQYVNEIRRVLQGKKVDFYGQMDGVLIPPAKIMEAIEND